MQVESNPASISDHLFCPRGQWYELCAICSLAAPAHTATDFILESTPLPPYRCPRCVEIGKDPCPHG